MADKDSGDKKLGVGSKTLSLKPRIETGVVRQSFSHGRSKQVVVEKKTKRRLAGDPASVASAARFAALKTLLQANLTDLTVVRFGSRNLSSFIVGRTAAGELAGLLTGQVET